MKYIINTFKNLTFPPVNLAPHHNNVVLAVVCVINHVVQQQHQVLVFTKHFTFASLFSSYFTHLIITTILYFTLLICLTFYITNITVTYSLHFALTSLFTSYFTCFTVTTILHLTFYNHPVHTDFTAQLPEDQGTPKGPPDTETIQPHRYSVPEAFS